MLQNTHKKFINETGIMHKAFFNIFSLKTPHNYPKSLWILLSSIMYIVNKKRPTLVELHTPANESDLLSLIDIFWAASHVAQKEMLQLLAHPY